MAQTLQVLRTSTVTHTFRLRHQKSSNARHAQWPCSFLCMIGIAEALSKHVSPINKRSRTLCQGRMRFACAQDRNIFLRCIMVPFQALLRVSISSRERSCSIYILHSQDCLRSVGVQDLNGRSSNLPLDRQNWTSIEPSLFFISIIGESSFSQALFPSRRPSFSRQSMRDSCLGCRRSFH